MERNKLLTGIKLIWLCCLLLVSFGSIAQDRDDYEYDEIDMQENLDNKLSTDYADYYNSERRQKKQQKKLYQHAYDESYLYNGGYKRVNSRQGNQSESGGISGISSLQLLLGSKDKNSNTSNDKWLEANEFETINTKPGDINNTPKDSILFEPDDPEAPPPPAEPGVPVDTAIPLLLLAGLLLVYFNLKT